jgi:pilus assembly protein CpaB
VKRISPATVTFGVMAIVLGLVAAFVVRQSMRKAPVVAVQPPPPPAAAMATVVIATKNIPLNTQITLSDMVVITVPKGHPATLTTVRHPANAVGRIAQKTIRAGQVVRDEYLLGIGETLPDLAERIPAGHRAVTIDVVGASTGGKRLTEGDYVDIALTVEGDHPDLGEIQTRTLMRNVMIVDAAAGDPLRTTPSRNQLLAQQRQGSSVTVAVTEADANRLIVAERTGTLSVTLCSANDPNNLANDTTISRKELLGLAEIPQPEPPPPPPAPVPEKKFRMEVYVGGQKQIKEFGEDLIEEAAENSKYFTPTDVTEPVSKEIDHAQQREAVRKLSPFASAAAK